MPQLASSADSTYSWLKVEPVCRRYLRVGPQHDDLPPGQPGAEDQPVEPVALGRTGPGRGERVLEQLARLVAVLQRPLAPRGPGQPEVVDVHGDAVAALELVRPLVDDLDAEVGEDRQHPGQRQRRGRVELEPALVRLGRPAPRRG